MVKASNNNANDLFSIGDVARVTGISVFNLRMWERRYGLPESVKLPSGHRRYSAKEIARLKLVKAVTDAGEKASDALQLSDKELKSLSKKYSGLNHSESATCFAIEKILKNANSWDDKGINKFFESEWKALGPLGFISERAANLLYHVGKGWAEGNISIAKEHFISGILEKFLFEKWSSANGLSGARKLLLSSLEGEEHSFGLHFCAIASVAAGTKVVYLGTSMPDNEIISAAISSRSSVICLSVSQQYNPNQAIKKIKYLRKNLPLNIELVLGGAGAPADIKGVHSIARCQSLYDWLSSEEGIQNEA